MGTVIYPPTLDWSYMVQRPQQIMKQFARDGHSVLFYNKTGQAGRVVDYPEPGIAVVRHALAFQDELLPLLPADNRLYWASWARKLPHAAALGASAVIYDCVDDFPDWEEEERIYAASADVVFCTADPLLKKMRSLLPGKPVFLAPNGCDDRHFAGGRSRSRPDGAVLPGSLDGDEAMLRLARHPGPVIGYIGALAPWVDEAWIRTAAQALPHALFYIAGPPLREETGPLGANVVMLGHRPYPELPALLQLTTACMIPFRINRITESTNPVKVYEYLAAGKPVVSSPLPEVMPMRPHVFIAASAEEFAARLAEACRKPSDQEAERMAYARKFSWNERYRSIARELERRWPKWKAARTDLPVEEWSRYSTQRLPLRHRTVNSYYPTHCLTQDPPYVGQPPGGRYETFLALNAKAFPDSPLRIYLEFDAAPPAGTAAEELPLLEISAADGYVPTEGLTDGNKPPCRPLASLPLRRSLDDTLAVDLTPYVDKTALIRKEAGRMLLKLSSPLSRPFRLDHPRLTFLLRNPSDKEVH
ncbi:glycosyltransferase [Gorillibacterium sp. sgz500922]|uniref:glycosyltransferase n=1 Tax=Gorillibacterium sp. sgz500922 TaxID=3446694 RepID=UPI003F67AC92